MALLPGQLRPGMAEDFYLLNADTAYMDARGCRACTAHGCRLPRPQRPVACGLFPLVLNAGGMYVYKTCPAALFTPLSELADLGRQAARWLQGFPLKDLEHIALHLPATALAERYISLSLPVYAPEAPQRADAEATAVPPLNRHMSSDGSGQPQTGQLQRGQSQTPSCSGPSGTSQAC